MRKIEVSASTFMISEIPGLPPNIWRRPCCRKKASVASAKTIRVVTFIPPAVEHGPPPTSMRAIVMTVMLSSIAA